ncbi:MAG: hypothetical protein EPO24_13955 [Bacteroidetes bacterium]|nr:MAG: hypothetical protein EPO24_13955 [Bacteroidota bacterium]
MLDKEFKYYLEHQADLVKQYNGKYIVIKDETVIGVYESELKAYVESKKSHAVGTFLIQKVTPGTEAYTQNFYSRVAFQ